MSINSPYKLSWAQGIMSQSSTKLETLGAYRINSDGRKFRYCKAGGALGAGLNCIGPAQVANFVSRPVVAAAIGDRSVSVTVGSTAVTANLFDDGYLQVQDGTGQGHSYRIESHNTCDASGTCVVQLVDPIRVALVANSTSEASLIKSIYSSATQALGEESVSVGGTLIAVTSAYYFWAQTGGMGICAVTGTPTLGTGLINSAAGTAGHLDATVTALDIDEPVVAELLHTSVTGEYMPVLWKID